MRTKDSLLEKQVGELLAKYSQLSFLPGSKAPKIRGKIVVEAVYKDSAVVCEYDIEIRIPPHYPKELPQVFEKAKKIDKEYHQFRDGSLCLGAPIAVRATFNRSRTLLGFVDDLVVPYLFGHNCFVKTGEMPFGELAHGDEGIHQYFCEYFKTNDPIAIASFLAELLDPDFIKNKEELCACGSGIPFSKCHEPEIYSSREDFAHGELKRYVTQWAIIALEEAQKKRVERLGVRRQLQINLIKSVFYGNSIHRVINALLSHPDYGIFYFDDRLSLLGGLKDESIDLKDDEKIADFDREKEPDFQQKLPSDPELKQLVLNAQQR